MSDEPTNRAKIHRSCSGSCSGPGPCQLCGAVDLSPWEVHENCVLWYCAACDLYQYGPEPGSQSYRDEYHSGYEKNRERKIYSALTRLSYIRSLLTMPDQQVRALDVGCSIGASVEAAKRLGWQSIGVDVSDDAVDYCNRLGLKCYAYHGTHLPFPDNSFDVITAWHVIEHVVDVRQTLEDWKRVLRPGGMVVLATPDCSSPKVKKLGKAYKKFWAPEHTYTFNPSNLSQFGEETGLEVTPLRLKPKMKGLSLRLTAYEILRRCNETSHNLMGTQKEFCLVMRKPLQVSSVASQPARRAA